jgi:hypothetical protein
MMGRYMQIARGGHFYSASDIVLEQSINKDTDYYLWTLATGFGVYLVVNTYMAFVEHIAKSPRFRKMFKHGQGGSARFGGTGTLSRYDWDKAIDAPIFLGSSLSKYDTRVGSHGCIEMPVTDSETVPLDSM